MPKIKYRLTNVDCVSCAAKIEDGLSKCSWVRSVEVSLANSSIIIDTDDLSAVRQYIKDIEPKVEIIENDSMASESINLEPQPTFWEENRKAIIQITLTTVLLFSGIIYKIVYPETSSRLIEIAIFGFAYVLSGGKVIISAYKNIYRGHIFNENFLMSVATFGAIGIDKMPEAVSVMLFYVIGEFVQNLAVNRSRRSIKALLAIRPDYANLQEDNLYKRVSPEMVKVGAIILVKPGEKIPLDGIIQEGSSYVDSSALTGESKPIRVRVQDVVLAGMINQSGALVIKVNKIFLESSIAKILDLVENATAKKANTEKFITTFSKYYTPVVVLMSLLVAFLPPLLFTDQTISEWVYRALVVLVISCPCALVISIPLSYFGGIGGASRCGILIKGSNYLDALTKVKTVVFDKTGTLTKGEFKVSEVVVENGYKKGEILKYAAYAESQSNHPIAKSVIEAYEQQFPIEKINRAIITEAQEISGIGVKVGVGKDRIVVGNDKILHLEKIAHAKCEVEGTVVHVGINSIYAGYIIISDNLKTDSAETIRQLKKRRIQTIMLTGDNKGAAEFVANKLEVDSFQYELLPEDKVSKIEQIIHNSERGTIVAFVGDGINDAPVLARADVGIAMGALGSDVAVETADIVLMKDSPGLIIKAIDIANITRRVVWQNIVFAMCTKLIFIVLGFFGIATMWEAVFGDMGVAILAILNATRAFGRKKLNC